MFWAFFKEGGEGVARSQRSKGGRGRDRLMNDLFVRTRHRL